MSHNNEEPNHATVVLVRPALVTGAPSQRETTEIVQGYVRCSLDHGALVFTMADGSIVAYGPGQWARVETAYYEDCAAK